ncbi:MAG: 3'-5' exonuclease [Chitinophagales bacterium]|nr:3'-5' exonuclease [Bacteroidota bacterium]MCB9043769.1 3'-5' exonuclease [Chitinophagales bacterium]
MNLQLTRPLAIFDVETTGVSFQNDRIVEIYVKKIMPDGSSDVFYSLVNPTVPIPAAATEIHGITDEKVKDQPTFFKIAFKLEDFLKDCDLAGFNSNKFDIPILMEEFYRLGIKFDVENRACVDVFKIFQKKERRDLQAAYNFYCGKTMENAHSASSDVEATYEVLLAQMAHYNDLENNVQFLHEFSKEADYVDSAGRMIKENDKILFNFGKYKGQEVAVVLKNEPQYYDWMMRSDFAHDTKEKLTKIKESLKN